MRKLMEDWRRSTLDSVPKSPTPDFFDRDTGERLPDKTKSPYSDDYAGKEKRAEFLLCD